MEATLTERLIRKGVLRTPALISAFEEIPRGLFVATDLASLAEADIDLPIECGATLPAPSRLARFFELLHLKRGQRVLEIGTGSGWSSAIILSLIGEEGRLVTMEKEGHLLSFAKENIRRLRMDSLGTLRLVSADGKEGFPREAPYERIFIDTYFSNISPKLCDELALGGILLAPYKKGFLRIERVGEDAFHEEVCQDLSQYVISPA